MGGRARWDRQRVEPASSWTSRHHRCLLGNPLLLRVDLLGQLAEDVIDLLVDGEPAAAKAISAQRSSSVRRKLGLCTRRQTVVELSDHSVEQVEAASNVVTAKVQFRMVTVLSSLICSIAGGCKEIVLSNSFMMTPVVLQRRDKADVLTHKYRRLGRVVINQASVIQDCKHFEMLFATLDHHHRPHECINGDNVLLCTTSSTISMKQEMMVFV